MEAQCFVPRPSHYTLVHFFIRNILSRIAVSNILKLPFTFIQFRFSVNASPPHLVSGVCFI